LLAPSPLDQKIKDWAAFLGQKDDADAVKKLLEHERTGRPLGSEEFVKKLEELTGRVLMPRKRGRPKIGN
jgi:putative transposase